MVTYNFQLSNLKNSTSFKNKDIGYKLKHKQIL